MCIQQMQNCSNPCWKLIISVQVQQDSIAIPTYNYSQRDSIAIPTYNYSQTVRHCWFVVSLTHVHTTNANCSNPCWKLIISVQVQQDSIAIPTSNYSQSVRHYWFVVSFTHMRRTNTKLFKPMLESVVKKEIGRKVSV